MGAGKAVLRSSIGLRGLAHPGRTLSRTPHLAVAIDDDDIGGVVTSRFGPEAGVWVIAETTRSRHPLRQDRRHRRARPLCVPDLPKAQLPGLGARLRPRRLAESRCRARQAPRPDRRVGAEPRRRGAVLPGRLLVFDAQDPGQEPLPRHRRQGQRHPRELQDAGAVAQFHQDQWLRQLPSDRQLRDAHHLRRRSANSNRRTTPGPIGCRSARPATTWCASSRS